MAPQAGGLPETLSTRFARQPLTFFVNFISPHHLKSDKPVESVEALSLASLPSACQVSIVQHWHRHKHKLVPLVPNLASEDSQNKKQTKCFPTFFALALFLCKRPWSSSFEPKFKLIRPSSNNSTLLSTSSDSVSSERVTSRKLFDVEDMMWQMLAAN